MAGVGRIDFDDPIPIDEEEDEETLAAIDEGDASECWDEYWMLHFL
jgi:hypothetical protein